jgi:hypothetical protein
VMVSQACEGCLPPRCVHCAQRARVRYHIMPLHNNVVDFERQLLADGCTYPAYAFVLSAIPATPIQQV